MSTTMFLGAASPCCRFGRKNEKMEERKTRNQAQHKANSLLYPLKKVGGARILAILLLIRAIDWTSAFEKWATLFGFMRETPYAEVRSTACDLTAGKIGTRSNWRSQASSNTRSCLCLWKVIGFISTIVDSLGRATRRRIAKAGARQTCPSDTPEFEGVVADRNRIWRLSRRNWPQTTSPPRATTKASDAWIDLGGEKNKMRSSEQV